MIAAVALVFITPWNLFNNPAVIHYTLDVLGAFIGPLYGVLVVDFYLVKRGRFAVDDLYTVSPSGAYWYRDGVNWRTVGALLPAVLIAVPMVDGVTSAVKWVEALVALRLATAKRGEFARFSPAGPAGTTQPPARP